MPAIALKETRVFIAGIWDDNGHISLLPQNVLRLFSKAGVLEN